MFLAFPTGKQSQACLPASSPFPAPTPGPVTPWQDKSAFIYCACEIKGEALAGPGSPASALQSLGLPRGGGGSGPSKLAGSSGQLVQEGEEGPVEVSGPVEVAGVPRVVQLHHRVPGQVAEPPQGLRGQGAVQLPVQDERRGLQGKARAVILQPPGPGPPAIALGNPPQTPSSPSRWGGRGRESSK